MSDFPDFAPIERPIINTDLILNNN
jgi:hypothetical protein